MIDLSIIIPFYNTEKNVLKQCLNSVTNYKKLNYEIIIINDGSKKYSNVEYEELISKFYNTSNINYIYKKNEGVSSARNLGIKLAKGNYITFVDSDDIFLFDNLDLNSIKDNFDIIIYDFNIYRNGNLYQKKNLILKNEKINLDILRKKFIISDDFNEPFAKIIKKEYLINNEIYFDENLITGEDAIFNSKLLCYNPKIYHNSKTIYIYNQDINTSLDRWCRLPEKTLESTLCLCKQKYEFLKKYFTGKEQEKLYEIYINYLIDVLFSSALALCKSTKNSMDYVVQISSFIRNKNIDITSIDFKHKIKLKLMEYKRGQLFKFYLLKHSHKKKNIHSSLF